MEQIARTFVDVLDKERSFAIRADVDGLSQVQEEKREALAAFLANGPSEDVIAEVRTRAFENVRLIRHLVSCLHGILTPDGATYNAEGSLPVGSVLRARGRL